MCVCVANDKKELRLRRVVDAITTRGHIVCFSLCVCVCVAAHLGTKQMQTMHPLPGAQQQQYMYFISHDTEHMSVNQCHVL